MNKKTVPGKTGRAKPYEERDDGMGFARFAALAGRVLTSPPINTPKKETKGRRKQKVT